MATLQELQTALMRAHQAGDTDSARKLAKVVRAEESRVQQEQAQFADYPSPEMQVDFEAPQVAGTVVEPESRTLGERVVGAAEAGGTVISGATAGTMGMLGGTLKGIADEMLSGEFGTYDAARRIEQRAMEGMQRFTYAPRTEAGREAVEVVGKVGEALTPLAPMAAELGMIGQSARAVTPAVRVATGKATQAAKQGAQQLAEKAKPVVQQAVQQVKESPLVSGTVAGRKATPTMDDSVGAARVDLPELAEAQAQQLDIPIPLTKGQKTGKFEDIRFEKETAKMGEEGQAFRERYTLQNELIQENLDNWIHQTGGERVSELGPMGEFVQDVLKQRHAKDKNKVRALYSEAKKSKEGKLPAPADTRVKMRNPDGDEVETSVVDYLNSRPEKVATSGVADTAKLYGVQLGILTKDKDGTYKASPNTTVNDLQELRVEITESLPKMASDVQIREATILKKLIDATVEPQAGPLFKRAQKARQKLFNDYVRNGLASRLIGTKKGTNDRAIAVEDVLNKVVLQPATSLEDMRHIRRLLMTKTGGKEGAGAQAWKDLQGATLNHIKEKAKLMAADERQNRLISANKLNQEITKLDKSGKLDFLFGQQGADKIRTINEVAQRLSLAPPGAINYSNTATVLAGLLDVTLSAGTGIPAPIASGLNLIKSQIKDARLQAKIKEHLGDNL